MTTDPDQDKPQQPPVTYRTARRPGQPGEENEHRAGSSPLSPNPTGPHAPYDDGDRDGLAAEKHSQAPAETDAKRVAAEKRSAENISVLGEES